MTGKHSNQLTLDQRILDYIQAHMLTAEGQTLLVAVSGGQDSVCLLHVLNNLQSVLNIRLHVAHLDHQLRGKESAADARYVAALAKKLDIPATIAKRDVLAYQKKHRLSLEEAAREVRYGFLAGVSESIGALSVAVGHTLDDQAETILLHIIRGTGIKGLRGLQPSVEWKSGKHNLKVVRPLLAASHAETGKYCDNFNLKPREDASNASLEPLRNRVRLELLPLLKSYNPQIVESLQRMSQLAGDDVDYLEYEADRLWHKITICKENRVILDKRLLQQMDVSLQRNLLRKAVETAAGNLKDIEARHIEEMVLGLNLSVGKKIHLPDGLVFTIGYENCLLNKDSALNSSFPEIFGEYPVKIPGLTTLPGWQIRAGLVKNRNGNDADAFIAYFDYAKTGGQLIVRSRNTGDRFQPLGMPGMKKLGQYMLDAKIPQNLRNKIPIIATADDIVWVGGYRMDERFKVAASTEKVLCLKLEQI